MICCTPKRLPDHLLIAAGEESVRINPANDVPLHRLTRVMPDFAATPQRIAVLRTAYWGTKGVDLGVTFGDNPSQACRAKILLYANKWGAFGNVRFRESASGEVRLLRTPGQGYYSYLGNGILQIPKNQQTMNLDSFTENTPDSEYDRVVCHEFGHTLGYPHEHMRAAEVSRINREAAISYFMATQGWSRQEVIQQVLTPLSESSLMSTPADDTSIMCYQIPGELCNDGRPIPGGLNINTTDGAFAAKIYPKAVIQPPPPPPPSGGKSVTRVVIVYSDGSTETVTPGVGP